MRIALIHGFNVRDGGKRTVDTLAPRLIERGHEVDTDSMDYGFHHLFKVRFNHKKEVERIAAAMEKADAVITHSNGANYSMQAAYMISSPIIMLHMSPALNTKVNIPACVTHMEVLHTRNDKAVKAAKWLIFHPWGNMGSAGYKGQDTRGRNHEYTHMVKDHSNWYKGDKATFFANVDADILESCYA